MTGASEILVLVLLISCILILPRLFRTEKAGSKTESSPVSKLKNLSIKKRAAIFLSFAYPFAAALLLKPWKSEIYTYVLIGIMPVLFAWALLWVLAGRKKE